MKNKAMILAVLTRFALACALTCAGCGASKYYRITDTGSGNTYYAEDAKIKGKGLVVFEDAATGNKLKLESPGVKIISKEEFRAAVSGNGQAMGAAAAGSFSFKVRNRIPNTFAPCNAPRNETVSFFYPGGPPGGVPVAANTDSAVYEADLSGNPCCGLGLQVNFYYWTGDPSISRIQPLNPDNSGGAFQIDSRCTITGSTPPAWGHGKRTWLIASIAAAMDSSGVCVITMAPNNNTGCVTIGCCDSGSCTPGDFNKTEHPQQCSP